MADKFNRWSAAALALMVLSPAPLLAADSTITITGTIKDNACVVAPASEEFTVNLGSNAVKQLYSVGSHTSPDIPFSIELGPCGASVVAVKVGFVGTADGNDTSLLATDTGASAATGVGIELLDSNKTQIPVNAASSALSWVSLTPSTTNTLNFYARLKASVLPVTAGVTNGTATFTLEYQ